MAQVMNDSDVQLQGASQRANNPLNSAIILSTDAPSFHTTAGNVTSPTKITITAHLIGIVGTASFSAIGGTITDNHDNTATLNSTGVSGSNVVITATVVANGQTFTASTSIYNVSDGSGTPATYVTITTNGQVFSRATSAATFSPATLTLTANPTGGTATYQWQYLSGSNWTNVASGGTSASYTVASGDFTDARTYRVQATISGAVCTDQMTVVQVTGGANGVNGVNAITGFLTNEAAALPATSDGVVSSFAGASGVFEVFDGIIDKTGNAAVTYSVGTQTNCAVSITSAGAYSVSSMSANSATAILQAVYGGVTIQKTLTLAKAIAGVAGNATSGARGAGHYYATGSAWSDSVAAAACPGGTPTVSDVVTISNGSTFTMEKKWDGSVWSPTGVVIDGSLIVAGSVVASKIDSRGLSIKDTNGNVILAAGSALPVAYAAPGTLNSDLTTSINNAATTATWSSVSGTGKPSDYATTGPADAATSLGLNPQFSNWTGAYPAGWVAWNTAPIKETSNVRTAPNSVKFTVASNTGLSTQAISLNSPLAAGAFVQGSYDISIITNNGGGTPGILVRLFTNSGLTTFTDTLVTVPDKTVTGWQRVPFTARVASGQRVYGVQLYLMAAWTGMPGGLWADGSVCIFDNLTFDFYDKSVDNTAITLNSDGSISGAGGGQISNLPVVDTRSVNTAPNAYGVCHIKEFKDQSIIGIPGGVAGAYCTLETMKAWVDNSGGNAMQWAYVDSGTVYKRSAANAATSWGAWVRDLDRATYTGDLNATVGATFGPAGTGNINGQITAATASTYIANAAIGAAHIGSLNADVITAGTLSASRIAAGSITSTHISSSYIYGGTIQASQIAANSITATQISSGYVYAGTISANQITAGTISANLVTSGSLKVASGGSIAGGDYTSFNWPASGGKGFYLGPEGLLLGNYNDGNWFEVTNTGTILAKGLNISGGVMTLTGPVINGPSITNPTLDSFTASLSGSAGGSFSNGSAGYGTLTANPSGGKAPYSYSWSLSISNRAGGAGNMVINSSTAQSASFSGSGTNATLDYLVSCIVTDANGRTATLNTEVIANHGTPP